MRASSASDVSNSSNSTPGCIGLAIIEPFADGGVGRRQRRQVVGDPADGAAAERVEPAKEVGAADPLHRLAGRAAAHRQDDGAADKARSALVR